MNNLLPISQTSVTDQLTSNPCDDPSTLPAPITYPPSRGEVPSYEGTKESILQANPDIPIYIKISDIVKATSLPKSAILILCYESGILPIFCLDPKADLTLFPISAIKDNFPHIYQKLTPFIEDNLTSERL